MEAKTDELSAALQQMQENLKRVAAEHTERIWMQTAKTSLNEKLRGDKPLSALSQTIVDFLVSYCESLVASFYVFEDNALHLQYAYGIKGMINSSFQEGEGLIGQAAVDKRLKVFDNLPGNYFNITSSLGKEKPAAVAILPAVYQGRTHAVIELGKFGEFSPVQLKLLEEISESIAITISSVMAKKSLQNLVTQLDRKERELNSRITAINKSNATVEFGLNGTILKANDIFLDLMGYTEEEVVGKHHSLFVEKGYETTKEYQEFWNALKNGEFRAGEFKRITKKGDHIWLQGNYNPIVDESGKPVKVLKMAIDITIAKKQQLEIDDITNAIYKSNLAIEFDLNGMIMKVNQNFLDLTGYTEDEVTGKHHSLFIEKGFEKTRSYEEFWKNLRKGQVQQGEFKRITKSGEEIWIRGNYNPILNLQGRPYKILKIATDVTLARKQAQDLAIQAQELEAQQEELRQTNEELQEKTWLLEKSEAELKAQQEELQQTNEELEEKADILEDQKDKLEDAKMEVETKARELEITSKYKSEFLANMSHELRTPLNSILILAQLLSENKAGVLGDKEVEYAKNIRSSGSDLLNLINEILDLSKVESGKMELDITEVNIKELKKHLLSMFGEVARDRNISFVVNYPEDVQKLPLFTDKQRLEQILRNLLSNAFKFTAKDGKVTLDFKIMPSDITLRNPKLRKLDKVIAFSVSDTGIGIPENKLDIIFEAFQQADGSTKRKFGGTGLGLSISRELASALGGEIHLQSEEGKGSIFTLYLPLKFDPSLIMPTNKGIEVTRPLEIKSHTPKIAESTALSRADIQDDRHAMLENDKTVLIIEDDAEFAKILLDFSRERGCKGIVAQQGNTGLSLARYYRPDAIILDMKLPVMDGAEVLTQLKNDPDLRHIPVQIFSGYDRRKEGMELGAFDYIKKPASTSDIRKVFERAEEFINKKLKRLLVVEDNKQQNNAIRELVGNGDVKTSSAYTGEEAFMAMKKEKFDCIIIDLGLPDMSGFDLLEKIKTDISLQKIPVIIYTGKDLSKDETTRLNKLANTVVLKTVDSKERLLDETTLFLHRVESRLPKEKQQIIRKLHRTEEILKNKKVLVVDDDLRNIYSLTNALEEEGMNCISAENGKKAIKRFKEHPDVNVILMDVMMPEMDGYEATREIRKLSKGGKIPIIAFTAKAMKGDREKCLEAGMSDYIAKPVNIEQLLSLLRVWLYH